MKTKRQSKILELIRKNDIETQEELLAYLLKDGYAVTQATVSRDIRELNLTKVPSQEGLMIYKVFSEEHLQTDIKLKKKLREVVVKIDCVDQLMVIKTLPGNAHGSGVLFDELDWKEKIGCICGNDTCLIISQSKSDREIIEERLNLII